MRTNKYQFISSVKWIKMIYHWKSKNRETVHNIKKYHIQINHTQNFWNLGKNSGNFEQVFKRPKFSPKTLYREDKTVKQAV